MKKKAVRPPQTTIAAYVSTLEKLREIKNRTGKTMVRVLADAVEESHRREVATRV